MEQYKTCTKCGQTKFLQEFSRCASKKDGCQSHCKICRSTAAKAKRVSDGDAIKQKAKNYREANPEKIKSYQQTYKEKHPDRIKDRTAKYYLENKESRLIANYEWAKNNPDKVRAKQKRYIENHPDKVAAKKRRYYERYSDKLKKKSSDYYYSHQEDAKKNRKAWIKANPDKRSASRAKRRGYLAGDWKIMPKEIARLYASSCAYCTAPSQHIDHIIPLARGGQHRIGNLVGACARCNLSKGSKFLMEWKLAEKKAIYLP